MNNFLTRTIEQKNLVAFFLYVPVSVFLSVGPVSAHAEPPPGRKVFLEHKCQGCHSVVLDSIKTTGSEKKEFGGDLSSVGLQRKPEWLTGYLLKKEKIEGRKHKKKFRGETKELEALVAWLSSLRKPIDAETSK